MKLMGNLRPPLPAMAGRGRHETNSRGPPGQARPRSRVTPPSIAERGGGLFVAVVCNFRGKIRRRRRRPRLLHLPGPPRNANPVVKSLPPHPMTARDRLHRCLRPTALRHHPRLAPSIADIPHLSRNALPAPRGSLSVIASLPPRPCQDSFPCPAEGGSLQRLRKKDQSSLISYNKYLILHNYLTNI